MTRPTNIFTTRPDHDVINGDREDDGDDVINDDDDDDSWTSAKTRSSPWGRFSHRHHSVGGKNSVSEQRRRGIISISDYHRGEVISIFQHH